ncbi:hypothetical protein OSSY52_10220 [Tepiditoga spiralis]|uniref:Uncharacterized protein n=1 Tax=Tepiditoga spiralis TaxID=2108365 RepID=A0A7G1G3E5_9BACT|nr:hypothetical protein [Tepiditoga spiralis]BBE30881.1 hypothetical protein OSSY52_10220 [Tepiditoga spiralis]
MNYSLIENFGIKIDGVYKIKSGIAIGVIFSEDSSSIIMVYTKGDIIGIDKFYYNIGIIDYYGLDDFEYEIIQDTDFFSQLKNENESDKFEKMLKNQMLELLAFSNEKKEKVFYFCLKKIKMNSGKIKGIPKQFIDELKIDMGIENLINEEKIELVDDVYKIKQ